MKIRTLAIVGAALLFSQPAAAQWTGCGFGAGGVFMMGELANSFIGAGSQGEKAGVTVNCDYRMQAFVMGAEVNYDWYFGDIHTLGAKNELSVMGRMGVLTNSSNLLYATAGWGQADVGVKLNSWRIGFGDEFRIPNSPMYLDLRALYVRYNEGDISPTLTAMNARLDSLETGARVKFKFGPGMFGGSGPMFVSEDNEKAPTVSDPKLSAPTKH